MEPIVQDSNFVPALRDGRCPFDPPPESNRDPDAFPDPAAFDTSRDARHHLAFSFGPHQCLGQPLARLELEVALNAVLRRMPDLQLAVPFEELRFMDDSALYGVDALPATWLPEPSDSKSGLE